MTDNQYTPGPWTFDETTKKGLYYISCHLGPLALIAPHPDGQITEPLDGNNKANAQLMATAPQLLDTCQTILTGLNNEFLTTPTVKAMLQVVISEATKPKE